MTIAQIAFVTAISEESPGMPGLHDRLQSVTQMRLSAGVQMIAAPTLNIPMLSEYTLVRVEAPHFGCSSLFAHPSRRVFAHGSESIHHPRRTDCAYISGSTKHSVPVRSCGTPDFNGARQRGCVFLPRLNRAQCVHLAAAN